MMFPSLLADTARLLGNTRSSSSTTFSFLSRGDFFKFFNLQNFLVFTIYSKLNRFSFQLKCRGKIQAKYCFG